MSSGWLLKRWSSLDLKSPQRVACLLYSLFRILGAHISFWRQPYYCTTASCGTRLDPQPPPTHPTPFARPFFYPMFHFPPGVRIGLFTPDRAFDMVTKSQIQKLRPPSLKLVDHVTIEMLAMVRDVASKVRRPSILTTKDHP